VAVLILTAFAADRRRNNVTLIRIVVFLVLFVFSPKDNGPIPILIGAVEVEGLLKLQEQVAFYFLVLLDSRGRFHVVETEALYNIQKLFWEVEGVDEELLVAHFDQNIGVFTILIL
jgi:hypothetical protein